jgi:hypothetical protein
MLDPGEYRPQSANDSPTDESRPSQPADGSFGSPSTWGVPTTLRVARGATAEATIGGRPEAMESLAEAVAELSETCDLVTADCGFFWQARERNGNLPGATLLSGLDLLDLAGLITPGPIGLLTFDGPRCEEILAAHRLRERLRVVGVRHQPSWDLLGESDSATNRRPSEDALRAELVEVLDTAFRTDLADVGVVVLECTVFPRFRPEIRARTTAPILDVVSVVRGALT